MVLAGSLNFLKEKYFCLYYLFVRLRLNYCHVWPIKKTHVSRPDFYEKESGRAVFWLFIISYCMLSLNIITFPQGYVGALRSNITKTPETSDID